MALLFGSPLANEMFFGWDCGTRLFVMVFKTEDRESRRAVSLTGIEMWRQRLFQTFIVLSGNVQLFPPVLWSPCAPSHVVRE